MVYMLGGFYQYTGFATKLGGGENSRLVILEVENTREKKKYMYLHCLTEYKIFSKIGLYSCEEVLDLLT